MERDEGGEIAPARRDQAMIATPASGVGVAVKLEEEMSKKPSPLPDFVGLGIYVRRVLLSVVYLLSGSSDTRGGISGSQTTTDVGIPSVASSAGALGLSRR